MQAGALGRAPDERETERAAEIRELWMRWAKDRDLETRNRLAAIYFPLARNIARMMARSFTGRAELGDLESYAAEGLLSAIERFEPGRGMEFSAFAAYRVRYAVLDGVRSADWVPRSVRDRERHLRSVADNSLRYCGRLPREDEEADELDLSLEELRKVKVLASRTTVSSIHGLVDQHGERGEIELIGDEPDPMTTVVDNDVIRVLREGIERLPDRQRTVILLSFEGGATLADIGKHLGVTESRACQIRGSGIKRLRSYLEAQGVLSA